MTERVAIPMYDRDTHSSMYTVLWFYLLVFLLLVFVPTGHPKDSIRDWNWLEQAVPSSVNSAASTLNDERRRTVDVICVLVLVYPW